MPASRIDLYHMQDARNNFDAIRPAPICTDANQFMSQCQNIHISNNCYYGYHDLKRNKLAEVTTDCEMSEVPHGNGLASASPQCNNRKRSAEEGEYPMKKRFREGKIYVICLWKLIELFVIRNRADSAYSMRFQVYI